MAESEHAATSVSLYEHNSLKAASIKCRDLRGITDDIKEAHAIFDS